MSQLSLKTFEIDVTPPVGSYLCGGFHPPAVGFESPLFLRGVILSDGRTSAVLVAIDYCYMVARSQQRLIDAIAQGAGVPPDHVAVQSNHVHAAPLIDEEHHEIVARETGMQLHNEQYFSSVLSRAEHAAAEAARGAPTVVSGVALAEHRVEQFASSRRIVDAANQCQVRWSVCRNQEVRNAPEGYIDPILSQIVFFDANAANKPACAMNFYASHPQVSDGRVLISGDTVGVAIDLFQANHPGVFPMYFTGCGGDVTAGKYTTTDLARNRLVFGVRLYDGIEGAYAKAANPSPVDSIAWYTETFDVPLAPTEESKGYWMAKLRSPESDHKEKYQFAMRVLRLEQNLHTYPFRINRLKLGRDIDVLLLPTELVVDYQFFAKKQAKGKLAVAAYGDSFLKYVGIDEMFDQGGYEVHPSWTEVRKGIEQPIKHHIAKILKRDA